MKEPQYVAYYMDRPNDIREAYKQTICLLMYYNAKANVEASRLSLLTYARENKFMQYFMRRPRVCYVGDERRRQVNQYGTPATKALIEHQTDLIAEYVEDYCDQIWFYEFLDQLNKYTDENKTKFDIIAALGMCELADEELNGINPKINNKIQQEFQDIGYYRDENGYVRFGIIPKPIERNIRASWNLDDNRNKISDPRYR